MRKGNKKLGHRIRQRQRFVLKTFIGATVIATGIFFKTTIFMTISEIFQTTASQVQYIEMREQVFTDEMSVSKPFFSEQEFPVQNAICLQKLKPIEKNEITEK